jgi:hypothetical protein
MVQFEAAERLVSSSAGDGDYRPVSVRVHFYSEPRFIRKVRKVGGGTSVFQREQGVEEVCHLSDEGWKALPQPKSLRAWSVVGPTLTLGGGCPPAVGGSAQLACAKCNTPCALPKARLTSTRSPASSARCERSEEEPAGRRRCVRGCSQGEGKRGEA